MKRLRPVILIVEDEPNMVAGLRDNFEFEGYQVITAPDGVAGLERALKESPDLVILDVMMPRMSGLDVCKQLKSKRPSIPIIMLTARGQEIDKVVGLELGADDYVTKPFSIRELLARVNAVLRRSRTVPKEHEHVSFGDVEVNLRSCQASRAGKALDFSSKEFELLKYFLCHQGETLSRLRSHLHLYRLYYATGIGPETAAEHEAIVKAIAAHQPEEAAAAMAEHITRSQGRQRRAFES